VRFGPSVQTLLHGVEALSTAHDATTTSVTERSSKQDHVTIASARLQSARDRLGIAMRACCGSGYIALREGPRVRCARPRTLPFAVEERSRRGEHWHDCLFVLGPRQNEQRRFVTKLGIRRPQESCCDSRRVHRCECTNDPVDRVETKLYGVLAWLNVLGRPSFELARVGKPERSACDARTDRLQHDPAFRLAHAAVLCERTTIWL
jgi:hypothetical protein